MFFTNHRSPTNTILLRTAVFTGITLACAGFGLALHKFSYLQKQQVLPDWAFGGFVRAPHVNPVISPTDKTLFNCPMKKVLVAWESNDTFNPAAAIKDNKVVVLYRAEDKSGVAIGERTSRLGYASSSDGLIFQRKPLPVFYPVRKSLSTPVAAKIHG
jgi:hypothetical protein